MAPVADAPAEHEEAASGIADGTLSPQLLVHRELHRRSALDVTRDEALEDLAEAVRVAVVALRGRTRKVMLAPFLLTLRLRELELCHLGLGQLLRVLHGEDRSRNGVGDGLRKELREDFLLVC